MARFYNWMLILFLCFASQVFSATWKAKVQVWIYPASITCVAKQEYQDGRGLYAIKPEYFTINADGKWSWLNETASPETCNGYSADNVRTIKENSLEQWVTVSAGHPAMIAFFNSNAQKNSAVSTWTDFCVQSGFTGVELDWEGYGDWTPTDYSNYRSFITQLGNSLHSKGKKLMLNGPPIYDTMSQGWYEWKYEDFVTLPVDSMSVMAYDYMYDFGCGTPVQPIDWMQGVINWTLLHYPYLDKIVIGIPSYGYSGPTGSFAVGRTNKEEASRINGFSRASRDASSSEMTWTQGGNSHFYVDTVGLDAKRKAIEDMGIKHVSVFHLGGNDWFTGQEPEGGYVGSPGTSVPGTTTPTKPGNSGTEPTKVPGTSIPPTETTGNSDSAGAGICCGPCSEFGENSQKFNKLPLIIAIVVIAVVGVMATVLGTVLGYRSGRNSAGKPIAGLTSPEVVAVPIASGPARSVSESFGEPGSPAPLMGLQHRHMYSTGIMDSPDVSQLRKSSKNLQHI